MPFVSWLTQPIWLISGRREGDARSGGPTTDKRWHRQPSVKSPERGARLSDTDGREAKKVRGAVRRSPRLRAQHLTPRYLAAGRKGLTTEVKCFAVGHRLMSFPHS